MTRSDLAARLRHLMNQAKVLNALGLRDIHEGHEVWWLICLCSDAIDRTIRELMEVQIQ